MPTSLHSARGRSTPEMSYLGRCPSPCRGNTKRSHFPPNSHKVKPLAPSRTKPSAAADPARTPGREWCADVGASRAPRAPGVIYETKPFSLPTRTNGNHLHPSERSRLARAHESYAGVGTLVAGTDCWRFARQDRPPILRYHSSGSDSGMWTRKWLRGRGKEIGIPGHDFCRSAVPSCPCRAETGGIGFVLGFQLGFADTVPGSRRVPGFLRVPPG